MTAFPILQFGTSRFLQAHADLFVSEAMARGEALGRIAVVQTTRSHASAGRLAAFERGESYRVHVRGLADGAAVDRRIEVSSIARGLDANTQWAEVERLFAAARCILSNTGDRGYDLDEADAAGQGGVPRSFPAKLARLLLVRHRAGASPPVLLPCELIPSNGRALREAVLRVLEGWGTNAAAHRWVAGECVWVNSLVDRIVSEPLEPAGAVAEPYALWAIERCPGLVLPCTHPAIVVTDDLAPYEHLKLFILNLGHSWLAEGWHHRGADASQTVRALMADPAARADLDDLYDREVLPVFAACGMDEEARAYRATTMERFANPFLDHRLADIFVNHAAKKARRFGGLIDLAHANGIYLDQPRLKNALGRDRGRRLPPAADIAPRNEAAAG